MATVKFLPTHPLQTTHPLKKSDLIDSTTSPNQLFVTNLTYDCQLDDIKHIFGSCGPISSVSFGVLPQHKEIDKKISKQKKNSNF